MRYPGTAGEALYLRRLKADGGRIVALRGPSGAGKTTLLRVLAGLQSTDAGTVGVSGPPPIYLPQRPVLPHARTVADVFRHGDASLPARAEIVAALAVVGLDGELGPDTLLGERGQGVSAGQRQRLALAAVLRRAGLEPVVLLLDEPTAHLDAVTERLVIASLRAAANGGCAVLAVAHRPALLEAADTIVDVTAPTPDSSPSEVGISRDIELGDGEALSDQKPEQEQENAREGENARWTAARPALAAGLGAASWLAGVVLTGAAAWLLVRASTLPPVLTLSAAVVLVRACAVARPLLRYVERLVSHDVAFARLGTRRARIYAELIPRVPGPRLHRRGDLLTRVVDDVDAQVDGLLRGRLPAVAAAVAAGLASIAVLLVVPAAGIPLAAGLVIACGVAPAVAARQARHRETATGTARARLRDAIVETVDGLEDLASTGAASTRKQNHSAAPPRRTAALAVPDSRSAALAGLESRAARAAGLAAALGHLGWGLAVTGAALVLSRVDGLSPEWAAVLLLGIVALGEPVAGLPDAAVARQRAAASDRRIAALAAEPPGAGNRPADTQWAAPSAPATSAEPPPMVQPAETATPATPMFWGDVVVRRLVAGWDSHQPPALSNLDLDLPTGARIAVRGASGSGKSTLAAILTRLLDPRAGTVTIGGIDLRDLPETFIRATIGLVSEDADHVFASTVRENLRLARPDASDAQLAAATRRVGLGDWPLDRWLGAGGTTMSGGQRKRFATARALLADPRLLILDEPTEGLDTPGAEALMADLLDAAAGRTVLLLTHRTEGLDRVDRTVEIAGGRIRTLTTAGA